MKVAFVHQNCPGQYKHLAPRLASDPANQVVFITHPQKPDLLGVRKVEYSPSRKPHQATHHYVKTLEDGVLHGQGAARAAVELRREGFVPDVVCAHMGWGEALYLKDIWPEARLLGYFEWYYHARGSDADYARDEPLTTDDECRIRTRNALHLLNLEAADWGVTPTQWQLRQHPLEFRHKISVLHDGIDTDRVVPDPDAEIALKQAGIKLRRADEVVTYVARNLEPYRGFKTFMRAAELILRRHPRCHLLVVGGDGVSYGRPPPGGKKWREVMLEQVDLDRTRLHFLGRVSYPQFMRVLQVSSAHIYLTVPFVLSWSMLEAMSAECLVIGSRTPPVEEVIADGRNGLLADFFSPEAIAARVDEALDHPAQMEGVRKRARQTVIDRYSLNLCLPKHVKLVETLAGGRQPLVAVGSPERGAASTRPSVPGARLRQRRRPR